MLVYVLDKGMEQLNLIVQTKDSTDLRCLILPYISLHFHIVAEIYIIHISHMKVKVEPVPQLHSKGLHTQGRKNGKTNYSQKSMHTGSDMIFRIFRVLFRPAFLFLFGAGVTA